MHNKPRFILVTYVAILVSILLMFSGCDENTPKRKVVVQQASPLATDTATAGAVPLNLTENEPQTPDSDVPTEEEMQLIAQKYDGEYSIDFFETHITDTGNTIERPIGGIGLKLFKVKNGELSFEYDDADLAGQILTDGQITLESNLSSASIFLTGKIVENEVVNGVLFNGFVHGNFVFNNSDGQKKGTFKGVRFNDLGRAVDTTQEDTNNDSTSVDTSDDVVQGNDDDDDDHDSSGDTIRDGDTISINLSDHFGTMMEVPTILDSEEEKLKFVTFNTGLARGLVPFKSERRAKLLETLKVFDADVICLQEVWDNPDIEAIKAAVDSDIEYSYAASTGQKDVDELPACEEDQLGSASEEGSYLACTRGFCEEELQRLHDEDEEGEVCAQALIAQIGNSRAEALDNVLDNIERPGLFAYGGANGLLLLSKFELHDTDFLDFKEDESTTLHRAALYARIEDDEGNNHHIACSHLTEQLGKIPYTGPEDSWGDEQSSQIDELIGFMSVRAKGDPQYIAGTFDCSLLTAGNDETGDFNANCKQFTESNGYDDLAQEKLGCTFCSNNLVSQIRASHGDQRNIVMDHIFTKNLISDDVDEDVDVQLVFNGIHVIQVGNAAEDNLFISLDNDDDDDDEIDTNLSNHFGLQLELNVDDEGSNRKFTVTTFNTGLSRGFVEHSLERKPKIIDTLRDYEADVLCLQEVWAESDAKLFAGALKEIYPFFYHESPEVETAEGPRCDDADSLFTDFKACVEFNCDDLSVYEFTQCMLDQCQSQLNSLNPGCLEAVTGQFGNSMGDLVSRPARSEANLKAYEGSNGLLILSKYDLKNRDILHFEHSSIIQRSALYAKINFGSTSQHIFCTQLSGDLPSGVPYTGSLSEQSFENQWDAEQASQVDELLEFIEDKAPNRPQYVAGSFHCGLPNSAEEILGQYANNCQEFANASFSDMQSEKEDAECTFCERNLLNPGNSNKVGKILDHIFLKNVTLFGAESEIILDEELIIREGVADTILGVDADSTRDEGKDVQRVVTKFDGLYEIILLRHDNSIESDLEIAIQGGTFDVIISTDRLDNARIVGRVFEDGTLFISFVSSDIPISAFGSIDLSGRANGTYYLGETENSFVGKRISFDPNFSTVQTDTATGTGSGSSSNDDDDDDDDDDHSGSGSDGPTDSESIEYVLCSKTRVGDNPLYCRPKTDGCLKRGVLGINVDDGSIGSDGKKNENASFQGFSECLTVCSRLEFTDDPNANFIEQTSGVGGQFAGCESKI